MPANCGHENQTKEAEELPQIHVLYSTTLKIPNVYADTHAHAQMQANKNWMQGGG